MSMIGHRNGDSEVETEFGLCLLMLDLFPRKHGSFFKRHDCGRILKKGEQ